MFNRVYWLVKGRVLIVEFGGKTYLQEFFAGLEQAAFLMRKEGQPPAVHLIVDASHVTDYDPLVRNVRNIIPIGKMMYKEPLLGMAFTLSPKPIPMIRFVSRVAAEMFKIHYHSTYSWHETLTYLAKKDLSLPQDLVSKYAPTCPKDDFASS